MAGNNRKRTAIWRLPDVIKSDGWLKADNCKMRSEFTEKTLQFYMGCLTKQGIEQIKPAFGRQIFKRHLPHVYEQKMEYRNSLGWDPEQLIAKVTAAGCQGRDSGFAALDIQTHRRYVVEKAAAE